MDCLLPHLQKKIKKQLLHTHHPFPTHSKLQKRDGVVQGGDETPHSIIIPVERHFHLKACHGQKWPEMIKKSLK